MISRVCIFLLNLTEQSELHIEYQTIVNTSVVRNGALCPTDCSNPAAGVNKFCSMEAEISANKTLGVKYHTAHLGQVLYAAVIICIVSDQ